MVEIVVLVWVIGALFVMGLTEQLRNPTKEDEPTWKRLIRFVVYVGTVVVLWPFVLGSIIGRRWR